MMKICSRACLALPAALLLSASVQAAPQYQVTDLGSLGGMYAEAVSVNNKGQVVGTYSLPDEGHRAFVYANGQTWLQEPIGWSNNTYGRRINENGDVLTTLGLLVDGQLLRSPSIYTDNMLGVNNQRQFTGGSLLPGIVFPHAYIASASPDDPSNIVDLGTLEALHSWRDGGSSHGADINDAGQVAGNSSTENGWVYHAFLYTDGRMTDLGTLSGGESYAHALNQSGQVTGQSDQQAFIYRQGRMTGLGMLAGDTFSVGYGINDQGHVVGQSGMQNGEASAFLFSDGQMRALDELLAPESAGWALTSAKDINDLGVIVGMGYLNGEARAFMATPVPESGTLPAMGLGLAALAVASARRRKIRASTKA